MNFSQALNLIRSGLSVRRQGWKDGSYVYEKVVFGMVPFIAIRHYTGAVAPWTPTRCDLYASDWIETRG